MQRTSLCQLELLFTLNPIVNPLRPNSAGITYTLLLRIEAVGFPTFGLLLYTLRVDEVALK